MDVLVFSAESEFHEHNAVIMHDTDVSAKGGDNTLKKIFRTDKIAFFHKCKKITGCSDPEKLQDAIFKKTGFDLASK